MNAFHIFIMFFFFPFAFQGKGCMTHHDFLLIQMLDVIPDFIDNPLLGDTTLGTLTPQIDAYIGAHQKMNQLFRRGFMVVDGLVVDQNNLVNLGACQ